MDSLLTNFGIGFPWVLDDFRWDNGGLRDAFAQILRSFDRDTQPGLIITGCVVTNISGNDYSVTEGWVFFNNKVIKVEAIASITFVASTEALIIRTTVVSFDPAGDKTFENATNHQTYKKERGVVTVKALAAIVPTTDLLLTTLIQTPSTSVTTRRANFAQVLREKLGISPWYIVNDVHFAGSGFVNNWERTPGINLHANYSTRMASDINEELMFKKEFDRDFSGDGIAESTNDQNTNVRIIGTCKNTTGSVLDDIIFTLPVGFRPNRTIVRPVGRMTSNGTYETTFVNIQQGGQVRDMQGNSGLTVVLLFDIIFNCGLPLSNQ